MSSVTSDRCNPNYRACSLADSPRSPSVPEFLILRLEEEWLAIWSVDLGLSRLGLRWAFAGGRTMVMFN